MKERPLLDMQLEERMWTQLTARPVSSVTNSLQLVAQPDATRVRCGECLIQRQTAGVDERAHHVRLKAHAFFVGEYRHGQRPTRLEAGVVQSLHDFEARQHAVGS